MGGINWSKVTVAGLAAGVVMNVLDFIWNSLTAAQLEAALKALNLPPLSEQGAGGMIWIVIDLVYGLVLAFLYAGLRPRFGAGWRTAAVGSLVLWLVSSAIFVGLMGMGVFSSSFVMTGAATALITALVGGYVAGWLYKE